METQAVVMREPGSLEVCPLDVTPPGDDDLVIDIAWSGISTGTERLLWTGRMPHFPGMGYPLVPGYEAVGRVVDAGNASRDRIGDTVFVPGSQCFVGARGLFGGSAARLVSSKHRVISIDEGLREQGVLLALAATARHALAARDAVMPELIVGHGVLGRLLARLTVALGAAAPIVWETDGDRANGARGYQVLHPYVDGRKDYRSVYDVSGDASLLESLIQRLAVGGEVVLAGFYDKPLSFAFPPAFMREARIRISAEWQPDDLLAVRDLVEAGKLGLEGLITHRERATDAAKAYPTAFEDPACLKMILDWRSAS